MIPLLLACVGVAPEAAEPSGPVALISAEGWELAVGDEDPFWDARPAEAVCHSWGYGVEDGAFEVDTASCDHSTFAQGLQAALSPGDVVRVDLWHADLWAPEVALANVVIRVEEEPLVEASFDIPGEAATHRWEVEVSAAHQAGDEVYLHISNHGFNTYALSAVERVESAPGAGSD